MLRGIDSETIDLIATDPPFNKGRDFHATPDSLAAGARFADRWRWEEDLQPEWLDQIEDDWPAVKAVVDAARLASGDDMGAFLCWLGVRVIEMRRVLKPTGSLYLHCDDTAAAWIKALLDAVFGRAQFRNAIAWCYNKWANTAAFFQRNHDTILFYAKGADQKFNKQRGEITPRMAALRARGYNNGSGPDGRRILRVYDADNPKARAQIESGRYAPENIYYIKDASLGMPIPDYWNIALLNGQAKERVGYPTQKPLALYERIVAASSDEGDVVLDPFAGCATTPIAAERLGRRWIAMDLWEGAHAVIRDRLQREVRLDADGDYEVRLETSPPVRTDGGAEAAPFLRRLERAEPPPDGTPRSRAGMLELLIAQYGARCQGCEREFDDPRYLQLDHNTPRADGGINHVSNRVLLCGPCNRVKGAALTLTGLRRENARRGWMAKP